MVKLLFCGDINGGWKQLSDRLNDLQNSQHGPFDVLFLTGKCFQNEDEMKNLHTLIKFPMKAYSFDNPSYVDKYSLPENLEIIGGGGCGIVSLQHNLTVAYQVTSEISNSNNIENVRQITNSVGYRGCDVCITSEWPKEMHHFLDETELNEFKGTNIGIGAGSKTSSNFAMLVRPRYHFVSGMGVFYQRSPYRNPPLSNGNPGNAFTRLLAVDQVSSSKDKTKKWLHALSVRPIIHLSAAELVELPASTTDCPYADIGTTVTAPMTKNPFISNNTDDHANKRVRLESGAAFVPPLPPGPHPAPQASGSFFFGNMGVPRQSGGNGGGSGGSGNLSPPSDTARTLFIGGLLRTMQDSDLESVLHGVKHIRRPPGKAFAFVEFISHEAAKNTIDTAARRGLNAQGRTLTVGWGKNRDEPGNKSNDTVENEGSIIERQLIPPSEDAKTLFIAGLSSYISSTETSKTNDTENSTTADTTTSSSTGPSGVESALYTALLPLCPGMVSVQQPTGKSYAFVEFESYAAAMAVVTQSIQEPRTFNLQGSPLVIGWATAPGGGDSSRSRLLTAPPSQNSQVLFLGNLPMDITEEQIVGIFQDCEISSIRRPEGREYAFIEFINPTQAQKAMKQSENNEIIINNHVLLLGWAKGRAAEKANQSAECWFCLASSVVKVHLIVSVGESTYLALPRGGVTPKHIQICPIECVPSRVHLSTLAKIEMIKFQEAVEAMFHQTGAVSLRYERALRTKGSRDHMQMHMIPLALDTIQLSKSFNVFLQKASHYKLKFHEIQDDQAIDEVVVSMEGGPYQEYFYIEIPIAAGTSSASSEGGGGSKGMVWAERPRYRRFVYVQEEGAGRFPMQFGLEVAAEILGKPERGHWKHCLLPEEQEAALCDEFRTQLAPFDFTLST